MAIWEMFSKAVAGYPDKIGVVNGEGSCTYRELNTRIQALGGFFRSCGIKAGDRISILDYNSLPFYEAYFAAAGIGAILNPLNYRLSANELYFIINDAGSKWLIANSEFHNQVIALLQTKTCLHGIIWISGKPDIEIESESHDYNEVVTSQSEFTPAIVTPADIAHLYYTSGTTGKPKGVILNHNNVCRHAEGAVKEFALSEKDRWGHIAPMFHLADAWAVFAITMVGGCHVIQPGFDALKTLALIEDENITISNLIPTMLNLMVKHPRVHEFDLSSLRVMLSGGAPIAQEVVRNIMQVFGCDYIQTYGMTETSPYLTLSILKDHLRALPPEDQFRYKAKTGRPFITVDLKVVTEEGTEITPDDEEAGEIWVKGETITPGYWNLPEETETAFSDGWLKTSDLATIDGEGYVNIVDRKKDMIISGGENIYSIEVENVLYQHPQVLEAAVFGLPDEIWGEIVTAAIVLRPGESVSDAEIIEFCDDKIAGFKIPRSIFFIEELPKTGSGKIRKRELAVKYSTKK
ncbi:MAG: long-chain-fatty-acid--CoA ligase [FCB group bacterium]|nr:long-chain-fatty-acid--CoA ligase [FCB group bacterium]